jgi:hypothetical protein
VSAAAVPARRAFALPLLPVASYLTLALVLPGFNGGWARPSFWQHAAWVFGGAAAVLAAWWLLRWVWESVARLARCAVARVPRARVVAGCRAASRPAVADLSMSSSRSGDLS